MEDVFDDTEDGREEEIGDKENVGTEEDGEKVEQLQAEIESLQVFYFADGRERKLCMIFRSNWEMLTKMLKNC